MFLKCLEEVQLCNILSNCSSLLSNVRELLCYLRTIELQVSGIKAKIIFLLKLLLLLFLFLLYIAFSFSLPNYQAVLQVMRT